jgi:hypothetical protein
MSCKFQSRFSFIQGVLDETSRTLGFVEADPGLIGVDNINDFTQGSQSCTFRNDVMQDQSLQGVKKRKVATPVVVCDS